MCSYHTGEKIRAEKGTRYSSFLDRGAKEELIEKVKFNQKLERIEEMSHVDIWKMGVLGRGNSKYRDADPGMFEVK